MNDMNQEIYMERICRRIHGDMSAAEAAQFDLELKSDALLGKTYREMTTLDRCLGEFPVMWPQTDFTASVMQKIKPRTVVYPAKEKATWLDWLVGLAPAFGLLVIAMIWGRDLWGRAVGEMSEGAGWLDQALGTQWFATQPFVLLGALIPVVILGVAYAILHDSWGAEV